MRTITRIILHCSATRCTQSYTEEQLERDHKQRGFKKAGYHFYIRRDGTIYRPRLLGEVGAHCKGWNGQSIGICYEGGLDADGRPADTRTPVQKLQLQDIISILCRMFPDAIVVGHRDLNPDKACPCFDAFAEYSDCLRRIRIRTSQ